MWNREVSISEFTQREAPTYIQVGSTHTSGRYSRLEYWQVWNREVPISEFIQREAPTYIQVRLHSHPGEYWQVWSREVPISEFTQREAPT